MIAPLESLLRIDGKIALVTDSGGCGSPDVAPLLARAGAQVIIADHDAAAVQTLARENGAGLTANAPLTETAMPQYDKMQSINLDVSKKSQGKMTMG